MIRRRRALYRFGWLALVRVSCAQAGVWGVDPSIGITGDYSTNPALIVDPPPHTAAAHGALLLDAPTLYNGDALTVSIIPSFRFSDSTGYSSLASDYEHLSVKSELDSERNVFIATGTVNQDSSLYQDYLTDGSAGVKRDTLAGDLNWQRALTERLSFGTEVNWTQTKFARAVGVGTLTDFRDTTIAPTLTWNSSERNKLTLSASVSRYDSLQGSTESRSANLQAGFVRQLSEIWSLEGDLGYSRALNNVSFDEEVVVSTAAGPTIELIPIAEESAQNGTVYSAILSRKGVLLTVNLSASRQLVPSGFAFLSQQTSVDLNATYTASERWSFGADARYLHAQDPQARGGGSAVRTPISVTGSATYNLSEHWSASLHASRVTERYQPPGVDVSSNEVAITFSRRFDHVKFQ
jgi:hypothetical protein